MSLTKEAPAAVLLGYSNDISTIPPVRIPFRLDGFQAGWAAYARGGQKYDTAAGEYDTACRAEGTAIARRRSALNGFSDGWNAAKEARYGRR